MNFRIARTALLCNFAKERAEKTHKWRNVHQQNKNVGKGGRYFGAVSSILQVDFAHCFICKNSKSWTRRRLSVWNTYFECQTRRNTRKCSKWSDALNVPILAGLLTLFAYQQYNILLRIKYKTIRTTSIELLQTCTQKKRNNCCVRSTNFVLCGSNDFLCTYIIWLWLVKCVVRLLPKGVECLWGVGGLTVGEKFWKTSCKLFNLSCSVLNQLHLNFALKTSHNVLSNWMQVQTMRFKNHCFGMNEWMSLLADWMMDKRANFSVWTAAQQKLDHKEMRTRHDI